MGYSHPSKAYRLYNPTHGKVIIRRDVEFNEVSAWAWNDSNRAQTVTKVPKEGDLETDPQESATPLTSSENSPASSPRR